MATRTTTTGIFLGAVAVALGGADLAPVAWAADGDRRVIAGTTSDGRHFAGPVEQRGERFFADLVILGAGEMVLEAPARSGPMPAAFEVRVRRGAEGARTALDRLLDDGEGDSNAPRYELVPVYEATPGPARPDPGAGEPDDDEEAPAPSEPPTVGFELAVTHADGSPLELRTAVLVGEKVELAVRVTYAGSPVADAQILWEVPGRTIKSYSLDVSPDETIWEGRRGTPAGEDMHAGQVVLHRQSLREEDRRRRAITFYWTDEAPGRAVTVTVWRGRERARASATFDVARSATPARDVYTAPEKLSANWEVLSHHASWHREFRGEERFVLFHREFLRAYNAWRELFGYLPVEAVTSPDEPGGGLEPPSYLTEEGGRSRLTMDDGVEVVRLADFASLRQLGTAIESPWHNSGHGVEARRMIGGERPNSDMASVLRAPTCEVFYQWHTRVDAVAREWEYLKSRD